jgi:multimeric flavodoxin WrbA
MKKILVIEASPRAHANSSYLADAFAKGAKESGNEVEAVNIGHEKFGPCIACYACTEKGRCAVNNDKCDAIIDKMIASDAIVFATPTYFYSMTGNLKTLIDRTVGRYLQIKGKDIYLIVTAWDSNKKNLEPVVAALRGFTRDCLEDCPEKGLIVGAGLEKENEAIGSPYGKIAYEMGKKA